ncbi:hypothetical protein D9M68_18760 [compost metagenome]
MANEITYSVDPGYYLDPFSVEMILSPDVESLQYSVNGGAPSISKYVAYDQSVPPVPFIAVTQDGRGNVVYDGGFPKFYNSRAPVGNETFATLNASFKYFYNAMRFIENPAKVAQGNRNVLVIGDATTGGSYRVKATGVSDFNTTLSRLATICGYTFTYKERTDWPGGLIDATVGELEQYCAIILFSTVHQTAGSAVLVTQNCIDAILTYRENGNGVYVITDHGPIINTIQDATSMNRGGFFATANAIITGFGAWFSGDYNRTPINVGFLRSTYGDHPLYNGMDDTESIYAGGSESRVNVATFASVSPGEVGPINIPDGRTTIQVAAVLASGEIVTSRVVFWVVDFTVRLLIDGVVRTNGQIADIGVKNKVPVGASVVGVLEDPASGTLYLGTTVIGTVTYSPLNGFTINFTAGSNVVKIDDGMELRLALTSPFSMTTAVIVRRFQPELPTSRSLSSVMKTLRSWKPQLSDIERISLMVRDIATTYPGLNIKYSMEYPANLKLIKDHFNNEGPTSN